MSAYDIAEIEEKRMRKGRVEYFIHWKGYDRNENTWETRMDLIKDGHREKIVNFERERKGGKDGSKKSPAKASTAKKSPGRPKASPSKSPGRPKSSPSKSKSPSPKKAAAKKKSPAAGKKGTKKAPARPRSNTPARRAEDADEEDEEEEKEESDVDDIPSPRKSGRLSESGSAVSDALGELETKAWWYRTSGFFGIVVAMIGNSLIPEIKNNASIRSNPNMAMVLSVLEKSTAIPSLIALILILNSQDKRNYVQWMSVCMVWRTAGEVVLDLPDPNNIYQTCAYAAFLIADMALFFSLTYIIGGSKPVGDSLTQGLTVFGALSLYASDDILYFFPDSRIMASRFLIASFSILSLSVATLLQENK